MDKVFPPHTRGCTRSAGSPCATVTVSPAHAGMYRGPPSECILVLSFPRTRGDVPVSVQLRHASTRQSTRWDAGRAGVSRWCSAGDALGTMKIVPWSVGYITETLEESVYRPGVNIDPVIMLPLLHNNPIKLFSYEAEQVIVGTVMPPIQGEEPDAT